MGLWLRSLVLAVLCVAFLFLVSCWGGFACWFVGVLLWCWWCVGLILVGFIFVGGSVVCC